MKAELIITITALVCFTIIGLSIIIVYAIYAKKHERKPLTEEQEELSIAFTEEIKKYIVEKSKIEKITEKEAEKKILMTLSPQEVIQFNTGKSIIYNKNEIVTNGKEHIENCLKEFLISLNNSKRFYVLYKGSGFVYFRFSNILEPTMFDNYTEIGEIDRKYTDKYAFLYVDLINEVIEEAGLRHSDIERWSSELSYEIVYL